MRIARLNLSDHRLRGTLRAGAEAVASPSDAAIRVAERLKALAGEQKGLHWPCHHTSEATHAPLGPMGHGYLGNAQT